MGRYQAYSTTPDSLKAARAGEGKDSPPFARRRYQPLDKELEPFQLRELAP